MLTSFSELYALAQQYRKGAWVFRGVTRIAYDLIPKIGRSGYDPKFESWMFGHFFREAVAFVDRIRSLSGSSSPLLEPTDLLQAGLLDWTENPLVAAYFACRNHYADDGAIYVLQTPHVLKDETLSPFTVEQVMRYRPRHVTPRISAQRGLFTVHPYPRTPLPPSEHGPLKVHRHPIAAAFKEKLRWNLSRFGINESSMFPGLDGLARHADWWIANTDPSDEAMAG